MEMDAIINDWKQNAERHDSRNFKFLRSLKMKSERAVDRAARRLHEEAFSIIDCLQCANCCKTVNPTLTPEDIARIAAHLEMDAAAFTTEYLTENAKLLVEFEKWLSDKGLAETTIDRHLGYIEFYLNTFLLYSEAVPAKMGASEVWSFFGDWFIRKTIWASPTSIRQIAASLKKFYTFMHERGEIDAGDLQHLKQTIKAEMPGWVAVVRNDADRYYADPLEMWGLPTVGHALLHILASHTAMHVGQMAVWRRAMGLPVVNEPLHNGD